MDTKTTYWMCRITGQVYTYPKENTKLTKACKICTKVWYEPTQDTCVNYCKNSNYCYKCHVCEKICQRGDIPCCDYFPDKYRVCSRCKCIIGDYYNYSSYGNDTCVSCKNNHGTYTKSAKH